MKNKLWNFTIYYLLLLFSPFLLSIIKILFIWEITFKHFITYFTIYFWWLFNWFFYIWIIDSAFLNIFLLMIIKLILVYLYTFLFPLSNKMKYLITLILISEEIIFWLLFEQTVMWF